MPLNKLQKLRARVKPDSKKTRQVHKGIHPGVMRNIPGHFPTAKQTSRSKKLKRDADADTCRMIDGQKFTPNANRSIVFKDQTSQIQQENKVSVSTEKATNSFWKFPAAVVKSIGNAYASTVTAVRNVFRSQKRKRDADADADADESKHAEEHGLMGYMRHNARNVWSRYQNVADAHSLSVPDLTFVHMQTTGAFASFAHLTATNNADEQITKHLRDKQHNVDAALVQLQKCEKSLNQFEKKTNPKASYLSVEHDKLMQHVNQRVVKKQNDLGTLHKKLLIIQSQNLEKLHEMVQAGKTVSMPVLSSTSTTDHIDKVIADVTVMQTDVANLREIVNNLPLTVLMITDQFVFKQWNTLSVPVNAAFNVPHEPWDANHRAILERDRVQNDMSESAFHARCLVKSLLKDESTDVVALYKTATTTEEFDVLIERYRDTKKEAMFMLYVWKANEMKENLQKLVDGPQKKQLKEDLKKMKVKIDKSFNMMSKTLQHQHTERLEVAKSADN